MKPTDNRQRINLGRASRETKGSAGLHMETQGLWTKTGISDR